MTNISNTYKDTIKEIVQDFINTPNSNIRDINTVYQLRMNSNGHNVNSEAFTIVTNSKDEREGLLKNIIAEFSKKVKCEVIYFYNTAFIFVESEPVGYINTWEDTAKTSGVSVVLTDYYIDVMSEIVEDFRKQNYKPILNRLALNEEGYLRSTEMMFNAPKIEIPSNLMFPFLDKSPEQVAIEFMNSTANVLLLYGEPGTGKTTYIKKLLVSAGLECENERTIFTVDSSSAMNSPELVTKIYRAKAGDIFILEDVDRHLYDRKEGNEVMSGILNAAEGLASPDVKIVISTNISRLDSIDSALIRPGRCFDTVEFKKMKPQNAKELSEFLKLDPIESTKDLTLAEIMNVKIDTRTKFGFNN